MAGTNDDYEWMLTFNPALDASVTFNDVADSCTQFATGSVGNPSPSTLSTVGTPIAGGFVKSSATAGAIVRTVSNPRHLGASIDETRDELYLCVRPLGANLDIYGGMTWRELF